jgi:hypothetical protein
MSLQQVVAEHWDLPNTEIFQSKDVAFGYYDRIIIPVFLLSRRSAEKKEILIRY